MAWLAGVLALAVAPVLGARNASPVALPRSELRSMVSSGTGREHRVFVAWPDSPPPAAGYPVIYLLDANAWFGTVVEISRVLGARSDGTGVEPAVIVGLGYPGEKPFDQARRGFDYTPAPAGAVPGQDAGGAEAFLAFIEHQVKPAIAADFPVDATRQTLVGHSFGGLFVLHVLFTRPAVFQHYVAISPSIWWHQRAVLEAEPQLSQRLQQLGTTGVRRSVFLAVGEFEQTPDPARKTTPERREKLRQNRMVDNARELAGRLAAMPGEPLAVQFAEFPGENHGSVVPGAVTRALPFLFQRPPTERSAATTLHP